MSAITRPSADVPRRGVSSGKFERHKRRGTGSALTVPLLAPWQVRVATTAMARDLSIVVSIKEIAFLCHLSLSYFVRAFSNTTGLTPYAWFMRQRIGHAEELLESSDLSLAQVALECGFSDQAHFTKAFVRATGMTPARRRREVVHLSENERKISADFVETLR